MNDIFVVGNYTTKFGERWNDSLQDLITEAIVGVFKNSQLAKQEIDAVFVANKAGGSFNGQRHLNAFISQQFAHFPPAFRIEGACASGGLALVAAQHGLLSGQYKNVLVLGVEKMTDVSIGNTTEILASAANMETEQGSTFPGLYALLAQSYMREYGLTREQLAAVAVKNHQQALANKKAHFHKQFTLEQVMSSPLVADPLRVLDCSPVSDGAAAVILSTNKQADAPQIIGHGIGQDSLDVAGRKSLTSLQATVTAAQKAYQQASVTAADIEIVEVHDCFTIAEILATADLGFVAHDQAGKVALQRLDVKDCSVKGLPKINVSGGLKACGHPVGATGVKQVAFLAAWLKKNNDQYALAHNVGGSGATAVVHILRKGGQ
jgi:acetyl-CoA C-acetyltransferase